jgi:soluble lytic murein transglycosylase-like protein
MVVSRIRPATRTRHAARAAAWVTGALLVSLSASSHADIYKKVDKNGVITFTNISSKGGKLYLKTPKKRTARRTTGERVDTRERTSRYDGFIRQAATLYQIPEALVRAVIKVESDFDPGAVSPANARGLMQLMPGTAERMMVTDVFDPRQNIFGGVRYLRVLANLFNGDLKLTLAGYNAGEDAVIRHGGIPPYEETQTYVRRVLAYYHQYRTRHGT